MNRINFWKNIDNFFNIEQIQQEVVNTKPGFYRTCLVVQKVFHCLKRLPQYKYVSRPIYKWVVKRSNPIIATTASFFLTDLIMHQIVIGTLTNCIFYENKCNFSYDYFSLCFWMTFSIPVHVVKYQELTGCIN